MTDIIKDGTLCKDDTWQIISEETLAVGSTSIAAFSIIPYAFWNTNKRQFDSVEIGLLIDSHELPEFTIEELAKLPIIAINFPVFSDGRGFSIARILREKYQYNGELRAYGDFIRDQLTYLKRCGFNSFQPAYSAELGEMLQSLNDFSDAYQADSIGLTAIYDRH